jgi:hypothetical protein
LRRWWGNDRDFGATTDFAHHNTADDVVTNDHDDDIGVSLQQYLVHVNDSVSGRDLGFAQ